MNILVVEDDKIIREGICEFLSEYGYKTIEAEDGSQAVTIFDENEINLAILDIQLPLKNGLEVLEHIRKQSKIPVLFLTAFSDEEYKISAFKSLADGYIEKPFSLPVLKVRIEALIKKYYSDLDLFQYKNTTINFTSYTATLNGNNVDVNAKELEILKFLLDNEGHALSRMQIIDSVWKDTDDIPFDRVIDVYIKELRKKLELDCIVTIRNVGYKLERK